VCKALVVVSFHPIHSRTVAREWAERQLTLDAYSVVGFLNQTTIESIRKTVCFAPGPSWGRIVLPPLPGLGWLAGPEPLLMQTPTCHDDRVLSIQTAGGDSGSAPWASDPKPLLRRGSPRLYAEARRVSDRLSGPSWLQPGARAR
jgi:hypothetical protein